MPYTLTFEAPRRFVMHQTGAIPASESLAALREVVGDPRFGPGATLLAIVEGATSAPAADELGGLALEVKSLVQRGLAGFVIVTEPGFIYGVARMFASLADLAGVHVEVFQDVTEARQRLDEISARAA